MVGADRTLHPYDLLANPKRRKILAVLEKEDLTYSEIMKKTEIDDSGKLSYHLGLLSKYVSHEQNVYSLSFEGKMLLRGVKEFEEKAYGVMVQGVMSGEVDATGLLRMTATSNISMITAGGDTMTRQSIEARGFDKDKAGAAIRSRLESQFEGSSLGGVSVDFGERGLSLTFEKEAQAFEEKDGWLVGRSGPGMASQKGVEETLPFPGMHVHTAGSILYPEGAVVEKDFPGKDVLEEKGIEVYELATMGQNIRWRVRKGPALYMGEIRIVEEDARTREVFETELHVSPEEPPEAWSQTKEKIQDLPSLVTGKTRFQVRDEGP